MKPLSYLAKPQGLFTLMTLVAMGPANTEGTMFAVAALRTLTLASTLYSSGAFAATIGVFSIENRHNPLENYRIMSKRGVEEAATPEQQDLNGILRAVSTIMTKTDPDKCYPRMLCEMAAGSDAFGHLRYLVDLLGQEQPKDLPSDLTGFITTMKAAIDLGKGSKDEEVCIHTYSCPFTSAEIEAKIPELLSSE